jgi:hypothetical protein
MDEGSRLDITISARGTAADPAAPASGIRVALLRVAAEPLLHFLIIGALLFAAYAWTNRDGEDTPRVVRIGVADVNWLKETWSRQWQRPPTEQELRGLIREYLKESLLAREAMEMGLDEDDTVIRRRLAQKLEFLVQDTARLEEPTEDELRRHHAAHPVHYAASARISFTQIRFDSEAIAVTALERLLAGGPEPEGDAGVLERQLTDADAQVVSSQFGEDYARAVFELEPGDWHGPVASAYGHHLVRVDARQDGQLAAFEDVRDKVREDWMRTQQEQALQGFHAQLLQKYEVVADEGIRHLLDAPAKTAR